MKRHKLRYACLPQAWLNLRQLGNLYHRCQMRDSLVNSKSYFELFVEEKLNLISDSNERINSGILTEDQVPFAKYQIFLFSLEVLIAKYSAGSSPDELIEDYNNTILLISDGWEDSVVKFKSGNKIFDQYMLNQYCYMVWMLSLGILLNVANNERIILKSLITKGGIKDELILFLLEALTKEQLKEKRAKTTYKPFKNLVKGGERIDISKNDVKKYLSGWYNNTKLLTWHNYSASIDHAKYYYGYWSFESAAVTCIMGLDDSSYRDNEYYPKDLVDYYRSNP